MLPTLLLALGTALPVHPADTTLRVARGTTVEIVAMTREVVLRTTARDEVTVRGASAERSGRTVEVGSREFLQGGGSGPITVTVPAWATVEIAAMNGAVRVEQGPAHLTVSSLTGQIEVRGGTGTMALESMSGAIMVRDFAGTRLDVNAVSGTITIDGATGTLSAESVNHAVVLRNVQSTQVSVETTNGPIRWAGALDPTGRYRFATHNGEIVLALPEDASARFRGNTFNGSFESVLPATTTGLGPVQGAGGRMPGREFTATLGRGEATVDVETFNGSIRLTRRGSN